MKRIEISPMTEIVYPNRGGYTGFSICTWETNYRIPGSYYLASPWGGAEGSSKLQKSKYVLEGRFFVFGSLLERVFIGEESLEKITKISDELFHKWKPIMDDISMKENNLWEERGRTGGIHINEIVNRRIRSSVRFKTYPTFLKKILARIGIR